ncbi:MAG: vitamin B12-dependent ribonucleotide reductase [Planctomycetaceae bacterium]
MHDSKGLATRQMSTSTVSSGSLSSPLSKNGRNGHSAHAKQGAAMVVEPYFCPADVDPFSTVNWDYREAHIKDESGGILFEQKECEVPDFWSSLATNVVVSKYFYGEPGTAERETSVRQVIHRVARTIADWGIQDGFFATPQDGENYYRDLAWLCLHQYGAFNSPVWFNVGLYHQYGVKGSQGNYHWDPETNTIHRPETPYEYPQASACFIQSVDDNMEDIMRLATSEAMLFKFGSGTGTDLSTIRSSKEKLSGGGIPSGPLSFMRVYDQIAAVVKSGGKTRRAAKMQSLKDWHPDVLEFIQAKAKEERKARTLIESGKYESNFNGEAYSSIMFQNANLSVRVSDDFMDAVADGRKWRTHWVTNTSTPGPEYDARYLMKEIAEGTWYCGDPGVQYETTINNWHTCPNSGPINASNPCSEYMFLDDTACNLASINLKKFSQPDGSIDVEGFRRACAVYFTAQEILVDHASYPTPAIAENSHRFRPIGLGYANLGSMLMSMGIPYDSDAGRGICGAMTAILHGQAFLSSAELAGIVGPFAGYRENERPMLRVMRKHRDAVADIDSACPTYLREAAHQVWDECLTLGEKNGYRNAQATVLAPTGTIAFMMDCDTTGIEPDIALVKYKQLAGGGMMKIVNRTVPQALQTLGYEPEAIARIIEYINQQETIEGAPDVKPEHLPVFDCAFKPANGTRTINWTAHVTMMAAAQPFLSGAISKTVNMPADSTVEDIQNAYIEGWKLGLKALAIYRDGSKQSQPLATSKEGDRGKKDDDVKVRKPIRRHLPATRQSVTHKFSVGSHEGYITVGLFEDGTPGELFITMAKEGSTIGGLMDVIGTLTSMGLQYGVPLSVFVEKFSHTRFEPSGWTKNPDIPNAKSVPDYIFRWLGIQFLPGYRQANSPQRDEIADAEVATPDASVEISKAIVAGNALVPLQQTTSTSNEHSAETVVGDWKGPAVRSEQFARFQSDAPGCDNCGAITVRNGNCYLCHNCGNSMGCS